MDADGRNQCALCVEYGAHGEIVFRRESRGAEQPWLTVEVRANLPVCGGCFDWMSRLLLHAALPAGRAPTPNGFPPPVPEDSAHVSSCDFCRGSLRFEAFVVDFVPAHRPGDVARLPFRASHSGRVSQFRLCEGCWTWARSIAYDDSTLREGGERRRDGSDEALARVPARPLCGVFLLEDDERTARAAAARLRVPFSTLSLAQARRFGGEDGTVCLVGAGTGPRATALLEVLSNTARANVLLVTRMDSIADAGNALQLGAGDFATSPLSFEQIAGSLDRFQDANRIEKRDPKTGLPIYRRGAGRLGFPGHVVRIVPPSGEDIRALAWLLRRFLRGYDRIGASADGGLEVVVYCPDTAIRRVLARLRSLIGDYASTLPVDHLPAPAPLRKAS
jgi:hypothetical protein